MTHRDLTCAPPTTRPPRSSRSVAPPLRTWLVAGLALVAGCYEADLDPNVYGVYVCEEDIDCALGSRCISGICEDVDGPDGPELRVLRPTPLDIFTMGESASIPLAFQGEGLELTSAAVDDDESGYIEVMLDGAIVDSVTSGDIEAEIELGSIVAPTTPGLHHITLVARRATGELFPNDGSHTSVPFWIDDGTEQVGIVNPVAGSKVEVDGLRALRVEVASLNFTFVNPGFISPDEVDDPGEGYVHLYVDAGVPNCLPQCNFEYQTSIIPAGLNRTNRMTVEQPLLLAEEIGIARIQIVAQNLANAPYNRTGEGGGFVYHTVPIQSVARLD